MVEATNTVPTVMFLLNSLTIGGSEVKTVRLVNALHLRKIRVVLGYLNGPDTLLSEVNASVPIKHFGRRGRVSLHVLRQLMSFIEEHSVELVVCVNLYPSLYARAALACFRNRRFKVVVTINTTEFRTRKERLEMILYRRILAGVDQVVFGAEVQQAQWRTRYKLGADERSIVLYNGVNTDYFERAKVSPLPPRSLPGAQHVIGTVGKLRPEKGHICFVRAIGELRQRGLDVGAIIVGDGPERARLEAAITQLSLEPYVRICGETRDVRPYLASMDLFVLASTTIETFSNAVLEAMSMGCPVVSTRVGGMPEMLRYGGGRLVDVGDFGGLTQIIADLITDESQRHLMASAARQAVLEHFSWDQMVSRFETAVIDRNAPSRL